MHVCFFDGQKVLIDPVPNIKRRCAVDICRPVSVMMSAILLQSLLSEVVEDIKQFVRILVALTLKANLIVTEGICKGDQELEEADTNLRDMLSQEITLI